MLTFDELRRANVERCEEAYHPVTDWSETDWAVAVAGEVGEACNLIKKRRRGEQIGVSYVADELADAVIYIDLLCARLHIDLGEAITEKFNDVSARVRSPVFLSLEEQAT